MGTGITIREEWTGRRREGGRRDRREGMGLGFRLSAVCMFIDGFGIFSGLIWLREGSEEGTGERRERRRREARRVSNRMKSNRIVSTFTPPSCLPDTHPGQLRSATTQISLGHQPHCSSRPFSTRSGGGCVQVPSRPFLPQRVLSSPTTIITTTSRCALPLSKPSE